MCAAPSQCEGQLLTPPPRSRPQAGPNHSYPPPPLALPRRPANTTANQGSKSAPQICTATASEDGWMALCYTAGCRNTTSWNGMPNTCYCPIYRFK